MGDDLDRVRAETLAAISAASDLKSWDAVRVAVLGKSGTLTAMLKEPGSHGAGAASGARVRR